MRSERITVLAVLLFASVTLSTSCNRSDNYDNKESAEQPMGENLVAKGKAVELMKQQCFSCHSPRGGEHNRVAPPMIAVKRHYLEEGDSEKDFADKMWAFLANPSEEVSMMPGAVEKFGLMPKMPFEEEQIREIAAYLYNNDIQKPDWFEKHYQEEHGKRSPEQGYKSKGKQLAMATKAVLGKNLMGAIQQKGTAGALEFCNTRAIPLTDSMAQVLEASIKRISDQPRNPDNEAVGQGLEYIKSVKEKLAKGEKPSPLIVEGEDQVTGYYPIMTNKLCLQCHGNKGEDIKTEVELAISQKYPNDKATGYKENELRGAWVVKMSKKE